jgi:branched-subunit amino acid aminotransferase/4-amino-4-deoxychorismate lyase
MQLLPESSLRALSPGELKGRGVFETMRVDRGCIFLSEEHLGRLMRGLRYLKIRSPYRKADYRQFLQRTFRANRLQNARLRLTVWQHRQDVHACVVAQSYEGPPAAQYRRGLRADPVRVSESILFPSPEVKSIDYRGFVRAFERVRHRGYDEAILQTSKGHLVEGSRSNLFLIKDGILSTPALRYRPLAGVTRGVVLKIARRKRIRVRESPVTLSQLKEADEAFLTNSLLGIMPLTAIGRERIADGKPGVRTLELLKAYRAFVLKMCGRSGL